MQSSDMAGPSHLARSSRGVRGFTLIELMVVVAIVAILVSIAVPAYQDAVRKSRRGQAKADLVELSQRAERFHTINNSYVGFWNGFPGPPVVPGVDATERRSPRGAGTASYIINEVETANTFTLTAIPQGGQTGDALCMTLTLNEVGTKVASADPGNVNRCW